MKRIVVTGGSGRLGTWVIKLLLERGYEVLSLDEKLPDQPLCRTIRTNLNQLGEVYGALRGADGVIHLAAIPSPGGQANEVVFTYNVINTFNILEAVAGLDIQRVVLASSESAYGFAWAPKPFSPNYFPVDEDHPLLPQECYGLSKEVNERTAATFHRLTGMQAVSLRFSTVITPEAAEAFFADRHNPRSRYKSMWGYIDVRDGASACLAALETEGLGAEILNITDDFTCMDVKTRELLQTCYPGVEIRTEFGDYQAVVSNAKAKRLLNWKPEYSWRRS